MNYKSLLLGFASDPASAIASPYDDCKPLYTVKSQASENQVWVQVETTDLEPGSQIFKWNREFVSPETEEEAFEECYKNLFHQIFLRGAKTLSASHSAPFLPESQKPKNTIDSIIPIVIRINTCMLKIQHLSLQEQFTGSSIKVLSDVLCHYGKLLCEGLGIEFKDLNAYLEEFKHEQINRKP